MTPRKYSSLCQRVKIRRLSGAAGKWVVTAGVQYYDVDVVVGVGHLIKNLIGVTV